MPLRALPGTDTVPFSQLQAFLTVARTSSFSAAVREAGLSRSAVSQAVRQLVIESVLPTFRSRHPQVVVEVSLEDRLPHAQYGGSGGVLIRNWSRDLVGRLAGGESRLLSMTTIYGS